MKLRHALIVILCVFFPCEALCESWSQFETGSIANINSIAIEGNVIWCATDNGVMRVDPDYNTVRKYYEIDGLNDNTVNLAIVDNQGNKWFSFAEPGPRGDDQVGHGIVRFDSNTWTKYPEISTYPGEVVLFFFSDSLNRIWITSGFAEHHSSFDYKEITLFSDNQWYYYSPENSGLRSNRVAAMAEEKDGVLWFGYNSWVGVTRFDGENWFTYTTENSGLYDDHSWTIAIDTSNKKWIGSVYGVSCFNDTTWTTYNWDNSNLLFVEVMKLKAGTNNDIWLLYYNKKDIAHFNGETWENFDKEALGIGDDMIRDIAVAEDGSLWLGCENGLYRFDGQKGVKWVHVSDESIEPIENTLLQNHPNPFNASTTISFTLPGVNYVTLDIFNLAGHRVERLVDKYMNMGFHSVVWDAAGYSSGIYIYRLKAGDLTDTGRMMLVK